MDTVRQSHQDSQTKTIRGVETIEWYDMLSLVLFIYFCPHFDLTPNPLRYVSHEGRSNANETYIYVVLILHIDGADNLDSDILTVEISSFVHINVIVVLHASVSSPFDHFRV